MATYVNTQEKAHKLNELIEYYEVCNKAEGKSPKTMSWYSANLKSFRNYLKNRRLPDSLDNIDTKLLREYVLYLLKKTRYENHPYTPAKATSQIEKSNPLVSKPVCSIPLNTIARLLLQRRAAELAKPMRDVHVASCFGYPSRRDS